jgi:hypothetical protein
MVRKCIGGCAAKRRTFRILERFELCDFIADQVLEEVAQLASSLACCQ